MVQPAKKLVPLLHGNPMAIRGPHEKGVPGKFVAQLTGHVKVDTTLNVYAQVIDGFVTRRSQAVQQKYGRLLDSNEHNIRVDHAAARSHPTENHLNPSPKPPIVTWFFL